MHDMTFLLELVNELELGTRGPLFKLYIGVLLYHYDHKACMKKLVPFVMSIFFM
jgi:hypothetical protein